MTIAEDEVMYKLGPDVNIMEAETEESSEDPVIPKPPPFAPVPETRIATTPQPHHKAGPIRHQPLKDIDLAIF